MVNKKKRKNRIFKIICITVLLAVLSFICFYTYNLVPDKTKNYEAIIIFMLIFAYVFLAFYFADIIFEEKFYDFLYKIGSKILSTSVYYFDTVASKETVRRTVIKADKIMMLIGFSLIVACTVLNIIFI